MEPLGEDTIEMTDNAHSYVLCSMVTDLSEWCWQQMLPSVAAAVAGTCGGCVSAPDIAVSPLHLSMLQHMVE